MDPVTGAVWRRRLQELARGVGKAHEPMLAPMLYGVAAQIDAIAVPEMVVDATKLRKNLSELRRMLALPAVTCAVPSFMELEALGGSVDGGAWPPRQVAGTSLDLAAIETEPGALLRSSRLSASVDTVRQFAGADASDPVIAVALTGPATLVSQLRTAGCDGQTSEALYDFVGHLLAVLVRMYCEAGVHLLQLHETSPPGADEDFWKDALGTVGNMARFHRVPPLLVLSGDRPGLAWPAQAVPCVAPGVMLVPATRPHAQRWPDNPASWPTLPMQAGHVRLITTAGEVPATFGLAELAGQLERVREAA
jgi:hypothetical protein